VVGTVGLSPAINRQGGVLTARIEKSPDRPCWMRRPWHWSAAPSLFRGRRRRWRVAGERIEVIVPVKFFSD
jgi:hypothetical protein